MAARQTLEIVPLEVLRQNTNIPAYPDGTKGVSTVETTAYFNERAANTDAVTGGRPVYTTGNVTPAMTSTNARMQGPVVMEFRPGFIPVPGTPGIGAWVATVPDDATLEVTCPFGMIGWFSGSGF